jgi:cysteine desulfurase
VITYLDHGATSPLRPEVAEAMAAVQSEALGNPTGSHPPAQRARRLLDDARHEIADLLGRQPGEIVFTSGGTESANLAIFGILDAAAQRAHSAASHGAAASGAASVLCAAVEHPAVWESCRAATQSGAIAMRELAVDAGGVVEISALPDALEPSTTLVAIMLANNETGVIQPLAQVIEAVHSVSPAARVFTDAVQAAPYMDLADVTAGADLVALSAHKLGGPVGVGVLVVGSGVELAPLLHGGGQERERRSGTQNVVGAVGMAVALRLAAAAHAGVGTGAARVAAKEVALRRDTLADGLLTAIPEAHRTVPDDVPTLPGHLHLCLRGIEREELLVALGEQGICASGGSSCASGALEPSRVLAAMGVPDDLARGAIRFTLGHDTTDADVARALRLVPEVVARLRYGG